MSLLFEWDEDKARRNLAKHGVSLRSFTIEELSQVADLPTPSAQVQAKIGIAGVAERRTVDLACQDPGVEAPVASR